jgi:hypothetical protein
VDGSTIVAFVASPGEKVPSVSSRRSHPSADGAPEHALRVDLRCVVRDVAPAGIVVVLAPAHAPAVAASTTSAATTRHLRL